jgi:hypothetical protein
MIWTMTFRFSHALRSPYPTRRQQAPARTPAHARAVGAGMKRMSPAIAALKLRELISRPSPKPRQYVATNEELAFNEARRIANRRMLSRIHAAKRKAVRLQRTPAWANHTAIDAIYNEACRLTIETGIQHHVDHEIPMQGKLVSGLHVENNLQVIVWLDNVKKGNRFTP